MTIAMFKKIKTLFVAALFAPVLAIAAGPMAPLDKAPVSRDPSALQHGAKLFVNYCLNCHSASFVRFKHLTAIGLSEQAIRDNLIFDDNTRVGDLMTIAMRHREAKKWFGAAPPDLSLIARQRSGHSYPGADWLYTYMRTFYRDADRQTGWNNVVFENVGMPHAFWELQGDQVARKTENADGTVDIRLELVKPGLMSPEEYDKAVADLVSFLVWMGEPVASKRQTIGIFVLLFLVGFSVLAYALKKNYWKDIH